MKHFVLAAALAVGGTSASAVSLIVDDYSTFLEAATTDPAVSSVSAADGGAGAIGDREFSVTKAVGADGLSAATTSVPGVGLSLSSAGGVDAIHSTKYGVLSPLNLDVTGFNNIAFAVDFLDLAPVFFATTLWDGNGVSETDIISLEATAPAGYVRQFSLSNFTSVDLSDIDMIQFTFDGLEGADLIIRNISFEVPVPAALPLLLTGLGGFGLLRLRRKA